MLFGGRSALEPASLRVKRNINITAQYYLLGGFIALKRAEGTHRGLLYPE